MDQSHSVPQGTACYNCGTPLLGPWCHACGQAAHDYHRKAHHLVGEAVESLFHADGRFWRTVPRLVADPAGLTRDYLAGKRAPQIPPMRLVLITLVLVFLIGGWTAGFGGNTKIDAPPSAAERAEILKGKVDVHLPGVSPAQNGAINDWLTVHIGRALDNPQRLADGMQERAHDFAFLMLPISAFLLAAIFMFRRGFVLFDHFVFSMHSLSFQGLLITALMLLSAVWGGAWLLLLASPVHLFAHMRGVYGTGKFGTLVRMAVLGMLTAIAFSLLLAALVIVGLEGLRA
jgi:hypothetical protein